MILIDAGPLLALHDRRDIAHSSCSDVTRRVTREPLITTWPCIAEAMYFLGLSGEFALQSSLWSMWRDGYLQIADLSAPETDFAATLMGKYSDLPMDLADATLVALADFRGWKKIFTLDMHFHVYRLRDGSSLEVILPMKETP